LILHKNLIISIVLCDLTSVFLRFQSIMAQDMLLLIGGFVLKSKLLIKSQT